MNFLVKLLTAILGDLLKTLWTTPSMVGHTVGGNMPLKATDNDTLLKRARMSIMLVMVCIAMSCAQKEIVVVSIFPVEDETKGFVQLAQDEVTVIVSGTTEIGTMKGVGGYFIVSPSSMKGFIKLLEEKNKND